MDWDKTLSPEVQQVPTVEIKKLYEDSQLPYLGSAGAAGYDLFAYIKQDDQPSHVIIPAHQTVKISTGLAMAIPPEYEGQIRPRSGLATKQGLRPANTPGTIDSDYRGPVIVALHNDGEVEQCVEHGERIAQICFKQVPRLNIIEVDELDETDRGSGGFGSTGIK